MLARESVNPGIQKVFLVEGESVNPAYPGVRSRSEGIRKSSHPEDRSYSEGIRESRRSFVYRGEFVNPAIQKVVRVTGNP